MNRVRLVTAVGALVLLTAIVSGSTAYGGASGPAQGGPINIGVLTPLTANFAPWGLQVRAGAALAINEITASKDGSKSPK